MLYAMVDARAAGASVCSYKSSDRNVVVHVVLGLPSLECLRLEGLEEGRHAEWRRYEEDAHARREENLRKLSGDIGRGGRGNTSEQRFKQR